KGTYTIPFLAAETFFQDGDGVDIPVAQSNAGQLTIPVGACCTPTQCIDNLSANECVAAGGGSAPPFFKAGQTCVNPPTTDGCAECTVNSDCGPGGSADDHDACTNDSCLPDFSCLHARKPSWGAGQCCDAATGTVTTPGCPDPQCQAAACSIAPDRGSAVCNDT